MAHAFAPTLEVRQLVRYHMSKSGVPFSGRIRVEDDLKQAWKRVVLDYEDRNDSGGHLC